MFSTNHKLNKEDNTMGRNKINQRASTIIRDNEVHKLYNEVKAELGNLAYEVRREYIYKRISAQTGLCTKCIAYILNHTNCTPSSLQE